MNVEAERTFSNVFLFVADALRYDHVPDEVSEGNEVVQTISSSGVSCTAFSTIASGRYPPRHGVWSFSDFVSDDIPTFYDCFPGDCPSHLVVTSLINSRDNAVHYNDTEAYEDALRELEEPFFVMDRELASHAVYGQRGGIHLDESDRTFESTDEYWADRGGNLTQIKEDYQQGAEEAAAAFHERLAVLQEADLLDDTLVVFTADHGEALGEHGMVGHTNVPLAPEVVTVPTVFYNESVNADGEFMAHVDLLPTVASLTGNDLPEGIDGHDLTQGAPDRRKIFNADSRRGGHVYGAFGPDGGHTFSDVPFYLRCLRAGHRLTVNTRAKMHRRYISTIGSLPFRQERTFGDPHFDRNEAREFCEAIFEGATESESQELDDETMDHLRALGYAEEDM